jgi:hypothetical protein
MLAKLDATERAGIRESNFLKLFVRCECGYVMTRRSFKDHACFITTEQLMGVESRTTDVALEMQALALA